MERKLLKTLVSWSKKDSALPILLRGARQVGKTTLIEQFQAQHFSASININFELEPECKACFLTLKPKNILTEIEIIKKQKVIPGKTLLFLDEIQECPNAIMALRYFKEQLPDLKVIAAGSLLDFTLNSNEFRMPVGRVQYMYLHPMSFEEFLMATENQALQEYLQQINLGDEIPESIHARGLKLARTYFALGGMPAVINEYIKDNNLLDCQRAQSVILNTYRNDFGKYSKHANVEQLQRVYSSIPYHLSKAIQYNKLDSMARAQQVRSALDCLEYARVISRVYACSANGLPLSATINEKKFKLLFLDLGLSNRGSFIDLSDILHEDLLLINSGELAEQFVGQELISYQDPYEFVPLNYWQRDKKNSSAEVDYVINIGKHIIPIEVKAGKTGRLKSMQVFIAENKSNLGVRISQHRFKTHNNIVSIPLYMISQLRRLGSEHLDSLK